MQNMSHNETLRHAVFEVLVFFDIFNFPLTAIEVYKMMPDAWSLREVMTFLETEPSIQTKDGMYFLQGREAIVAIRHKRYRIADQKFKKARKAVWALSKVHSIEGIYICNNLGFCNASEESDIDLLIVTQPGGIWRSRFAAMIISQLFGVRMKDSSADKLCLSFFADKESLNFDQLRHQEDPYFYYWMHGVYPLYEKNSDMVVKANTWVRLKKQQRIAKRRAYTNTLDATLYIPVLFEKILKKVQLHKMSHYKKMRASLQHTDVIITDHMLKFHDNDRRAVYANFHKQQLKKYV